MQTRGYADRIRTKNNMYPTPNPPIVGDIIQDGGGSGQLKFGIGTILAIFVSNCQ